jgi:hypothetical protein
MIKAEIKYSIIPSEFDGLYISVMKDANRYKLFISRDLLGENGLEIWNWDDKNYYNNFIEENIEPIIDGIGSGFYRKFSDGYFVDRKAQF